MYEGVNYPKTAEANARVQDIYGSGPGRLLSDYNAQTYWLSINPHSFMEEGAKFPKWLNIAVGHSADGLLGGRVNYWCPEEYDNFRPEDCPQNLRIDYSHIPRERQWYLSFDIDISKIETNSPLLRTLLDAVSIVKIPAPALELDGDGDLHLRALR